MKGGALNNDIFAIIDEDGAKDEIKKIQKAIYDASFNSKLVEKASYKRQNRISTLNQIYHLKLLEIEKDPGFVLFLSFLKSKKRAWELRHDFKTMTQTDLDFAKWILTREKMAFVGLSDKKIIEKASFILERNDFFMKWFKFDAMSGKSFLEIARKDLGHFLIKLTVMYTSGPGLIANVLFPEICYRKRDSEGKMAPYSFKYYQLDQAFVSLNGIQDTVESEQQPRGYLRKGNDVSWLEEGKKRIHNHEEKLKTTALKIYSSYKSFQEKQGKESLWHSRSSPSHAPQGEPQSKLSHKIEANLFNIEVNSVARFFNQSVKLRQLRKDLSLELIDKLNQKIAPHSLELSIESPAHLEAFMSLTTYLISSACKSPKIREKIIQNFQNKETFIRLIKSNSNPLKLEALLSPCKKALREKIISPYASNFSRLLNEFDSPQFNIVAKVFFPDFLTANFKFMSFFSRIDSSKRHDFILAIKEQLPRVINIGELIDILQTNFPNQTIKYIKELRAEFLGLCWRYDQWLLVFEKTANQEELSLAILDLQEDLAQTITTTAEFLQLSSFLQKRALIQFINLLKPQLAELIKTEEELSQVMLAFSANKSALDEIFQALRENFSDLGCDSEDFLDSESEGDELRFLF